MSTFYRKDHFKTPGTGPLELINASSYERRYFQAGNVPPYGILSHRWSEQEVTYKEAKDATFVIRQGSKHQGARKVLQLCKRALEHGLQYVWVDTCCIDKRSSAALDEAINSMFSYYQNAAECFVHMADFHMDEQNPAAAEASFVQSEWFKRGWTLQELIAPSKISFFDTDWNWIGTKDSLLRLIGKASGITFDDFRYFHRLKYLSVLSEVAHDKPSIARIFSWASDRITTRPEDITYSLIGLCGVYLPLQYGEGSLNAFRRLQEEILRSTEEESVLAWAVPNKLHDNSIGNCIAPFVAVHPKDFADCGDVITIRRTESTYINRPPYYLTNRGLAMTAKLYPAASCCRLIDQSSYRAMRGFVTPLNCRRKGSDQPLVLPLLQATYNKGLEFNQVWLRWDYRCEMKSDVQMDVEPELIYITNKVPV